MRLFHGLAVARPIPKEPVPFKTRIPLKLRNHVSGKGDGRSDVSCVYEMSVLMACLKKNEFSESLCSREIGTFQKCYTDSTASKKLKKEHEAKGILIPGDKNLSSKQLNMLLSQYPNLK